MRKETILVLLVLLYGFTVQGGKDQKQITTQDQISLNKQPSELHITFNANQNPTIGVQTSSQAKSTSVVEAHFKNLINNIQNFSAASASRSIVNRICAYKWPLLLLSTTSCYVGLVAFFSWINYYLGQEKSWAKWKHHLSVQELQAYSVDENKKQELMHNLVDSILHRYLNVKEPTNRISPLVQFIITIDREAKQLKYYVFLAKIISKMHLKKIFPINETKIKQAQEGLQRLQLVKDLFVRWTVLHNAYQFLHSNQLKNKPNFSIRTLINRELKRTNDSTKSLHEWQKQTIY